MIPRTNPPTPRLPETGSPMDDDIRYQAFISYARDNNQPSTLPGPDGVCRGWVATLHKELSRCLIQNLSRELRRGQRDGLLWLDIEQVQGGIGLTPQIEARLGACRLLLPILSPRWFESGWCLQEFETFLRLHQDDLDRVFPVWMRPVDPKSLDARARAKWERLREKTGFDFHYADGRHIRTRWDPIPDPLDRAYLHKVEDLAAEMAQGIARLARAEASAASPPHPPAPEPGQSPTLAMAPASGQVTPPGAGAPPRHEVLVNGGIDDAARILAVATALGERRLGYAVPLHTQPEHVVALKPSQLRQDLRTKLRRCTAILFVYCDGPAHLLDEQIDLCDRAAAVPRPDLPPPSLDLCNYGRYPLGLCPPRLTVHKVSDDQHCVETFVAALTARSAP